MENSLRIIILIASIILGLVILQLLRRGRIPVKFSLLWIIVVLALFVLAIAPDFLMFFMRLEGFQTLSNLTIGIFLAILFFMSIALTVIVSGQKTKIQLLIQEVSMLKSKLEERDSE